MYILIKKLLKAQTWWDQGRQYNDYVKIDINKNKWVNKYTIIQV